MANRTDLLNIGFEAGDNVLRGMSVPLRCYGVFEDGCEAPEVIRKVIGDSASRQVESSDEPAWVFGAVMVAFGLPGNLPVLVEERQEQKIAMVVKVIERVKPV